MCFLCDYLRQTNELRVCQKVKGCQADPDYTDMQIYIHGNVIVLVKLISWDVHNKLAIIVARKW